MSQTDSHVIRLASLRHLDDLVRLERAAFATDRFTADQIEYLITQAHGTILVLEAGGTVVGAAYLLWRKGLDSGRLYNLVVDPSQQGKGFGLLLLREAELEAARRRKSKLVLEVRADNDAAIRFYERYGYKITATLKDYYEDHSTGYKMSRVLDVSVIDRVRLKIPYYPQSLDFTCGPACLMMAMRVFRSDQDLDEIAEINLWREATLVFMTSGHGGTGPHGMALAARLRGHEVRLLLSTDTVPFMKSVRAERKREIIKLVHDDLRSRALDAGVVRSLCDFTFEDIAAAMHRSFVPIILISTFRLTGDREPHWVVVSGFDGDTIFLKDPDLKSYQGDRKGAAEVRISRDEFQRVSRYGREIVRSAILIGPVDSGRSSGE